MAVIPNYHSATFFPPLLDGARVKTKYKTTVLRMKEGHEERIGEWQDALREFDVTPALRDQEDLEQVLAFFHARGGPRYAFKMYDPIDYTVEDFDSGVFGFGDGHSTGFQLVKRYHTGLVGDSYYGIRPIALIDNPAQIYFDDTLQSSGYSVDEHFGVVYFSSAPPRGVTLSWRGSFGVPARFAQARMATAVDAYKRYGWKVSIAEVRAPVFVNVYPETQQPDCVDVRLPSRFSSNSIFGPEFDVIALDADSGEVNRIPQFVEGKSQFSIEQQIRTLDDMKLVLNMFHARKGRLVGFRYQDITDHTVAEWEGQLLPIGTGVYQLQKVYNSYGVSNVKSIYKPVVGSIVLLNGGVPVTSGFTLDYSTGKVHTSGATVTNWTGEFDIPVRFASDEIDVTVDGFEVYNWSAIGFTEIMLDLPNVVIG